MTVEICLENEILKASVEGKLDSVSSSELETAVREKLDDKVKTIVLDMEKVDFVSSKGLRILVSLYKSLPSGDLRLENVNNLVLEVLKLSGLLNVFRVQGK